MKTAPKGDPMNKNEINPYISPATLVKVIRSLMTKSTIVALDIQRESDEDKKLNLGGVSRLLRTANRQRRFKEVTDTIDAGMVLANLWGMNHTQIYDEWFKDMLVSSVINEADRAKLKEVADKVDKELVAKSGSSTGKITEPYDVLPLLKGVQ